MPSRYLSLTDRLLTEIDTGLRALAGPLRAVRPSPAGDAGDGSPGATDRRLAAGLMRVNHAGEVAAQALYRGQALTTGDPALRARLQQAAVDEEDHLAWCRQRLAELGGRASLLGPAWYAGSFILGALAGLAGRGPGLGFVAETERQVEQHLSGHLERLPPADQRSRRILMQMKADEAGHGAAAQALGAAELPGAVRTAMRLSARVMTTLARWI